MCVCVCVVNRIKIVYLLISDDERNENPWPALWTESQAREFKNRHPWLEWRDSKLGRYQLLSTHENVRPKMTLLVSGRNKKNRRKCKPKMNVTCPSQPCASA